MNVVSWRDDGSHAEALRALADAAFGAAFTDDDWDHTCGGVRVALFHDGDPLAQAAVVPRRIVVGESAFDTGYVEAVCVAPATQRRGLGTLVMKEVDRVLRAEFEMGFLSTSSPSFYELLGWERWHGPSYVLDATAEVRTADEDEGLMVLRFGRSAHVDFANRVMCESRAGDDW